MSVVHKNNFQAVFSTRDGLFVQRKEDVGKRDRGLHFVIAELEKFEAILVSIMRVEDTPLLPRILKGSPFEAQFSSDRTIELRRKGQNEDTGLRFNFEEGEDLLWVARTAAAGFAAESQTASRGTNHAYWPSSDAPFDGR